MSWRRPLAVGLYVLAEALLWFIALRTFASSVERNRFADLAQDIERGIRTSDFLQPDRAQDALAMAEIAADAAVGGAPMIVVLALAFAAFGLMRVLAMSDLPAAARAAAGVSGSILFVTAGIQVDLDSAGDFTRLGAQALLELDVEAVGFGIVVQFHRVPLLKPRVWCEFPYRLPTGSLTTNPLTIRLPPWGGLAASSSPSPI